LRTKLGGRVAVKAMAAKLARLVYRILRYGMKYVDQGANFYETQHRNQQLKQLKWKAAKLGYQLVLPPAT
jgi:transposase